MSLKMSLPRRAGLGRASSSQSAQADASTQAAALALLAANGADITLHPPLDLPASVLERLVEQTAWRCEPIRLFGRLYPQPRLIAWHGDADATYRYSGLSLTPEPWTPLLTDLRDHVARLSNATFNSVLLNYYRTEQDSMGLHADDEPELGRHPVIASLSLGAPRAMLFRHRTNRALPPTRLLLPPASLLVMRANTQSLWKHGIEKSRTACAPRLNLTFRRILPPYTKGKPTWTPSAPP